MKIEIQGQDAVKATEALLAIEGLEGSYETISEVERGEPLTTIATVVAITAGTLTIAEKLYQLKKKYFQDSTGSRIEKVLIVAPNGNRLLLKDATLKQIQEILED
ncbi:MAG: hypothetical protein AB4368_22155 [Xenococcaceae cyanobacterium]